MQHAEWVSLKWVFKFHDRLKLKLKRQQGDLLTSSQIRYIKIFILIPFLVLRIVLFICQMEKLVFCRVLVDDILNENVPAYSHVFVCIRSENIGQ